MAASCDAAIAAHAAGRLQKVTYMSSSMVFESTDTWPSVEGDERKIAAAAVLLRLPEAGGRVLRPRRVGPVPAAVHDRPAVQLRGHRRGAGPGRRRGRQRQREAGHEPRRARPRAEGAEGAGPAAHPRRRLPGPALHLRRRPGQGHRHRDGAPRRPATRTSTCRRRESTTVLELAEVIWRKIKGPDAPLRIVSDPAFEHDVQPRVPSTEKAKRVLGLRGHHHPRGHARRGHPVDPAGRGRRAHLNRAVTSVRSIVQAPRRGCSGISSW